MIMTTILRSNSGECPLWGVAVSVRGWYEEKEKNVWSFLRAECPIIENAKLPLYKQKQEYTGWQTEDKTGRSLRNH